ncbi:MAG: tRNA ((6)-L-threonylcarbamoyladenosine(37)-C(2))-methylthiotransferase MtaB [Dehalococcoidia bacterium]|nr:tRNA ((6)-L-threonylcarbamoyladenosine(37)-C(2))-methylthiotransferase MtaB [Dehalococcoidia bacterium]
MNSALSGQSEDTVAIETLGCKLNLADSEILLRRFTEAGFRPFDSALRVSGVGQDRPSAPQDSPTIYLLNTCTVTHIADRKARHLLRLARRRYPEAFIIATGCFPQRSQKEVEALGIADLVAGNDAKPRLVEMVLEALDGSRGLEAYCQPAHESALGGHPVWQDLPRRRVRTFVKIQEGCNDYCSYCIIPKTRGRSRSIPPEEILSEVQLRVDEGYQEVVLTGTQLGDYGEEKTGRGWEGRLQESLDSQWQDHLADLIGRILKETNVQRLRISSLQPQDITPSLLELWGSDRLCPHFHIPLQSGSDGVLNRMRRRYSRKMFASTVDRLRATIPDVSITTDIIVGFPGETDEEFQESYRFCQEMAFAAIHTFPYSKRTGTSAARMAQEITDPIKKDRSDIILGLAQESASRFRSGFLGRVLPVLWEERKSGATCPSWSGLTGNYVRVHADSPQPLLGEITPTVMDRDEGQAIWGRVVM